jgi:sulfite exporter TauE/SafE
MLIPFIAMQFSDEVNWSGFDFIIGGILLFLFGLLISFVSEKLKNSKFRLPIIIAIVLVLFLIWAELAVEIFN